MNHKIGIFDSGIGGVTVLKEILKIFMKVKKDGYSLVPLEMFFYQGLVKVEIGLGKGKKLYDKRESIAKKSQERDMQRLMNR